MKLIALLCTAFLVSAVHAEQVPSLYGTYASTENKSTVIVIDQADRILSTSLQIRVGQFVYPIRFPHRLRWSEFTGVYSTVGAVQVNLTNGVHQRVCEYAVTIDIDAYQAGQAMDVTLSYPQSVILDSWGRCGMAGVNRTPYGFTRLP